MANEEDADYERELREVLGDDHDAAGELDDTYSDNQSETSSLRVVPAIAIDNDWDEVEPRRPTDIVSPSMASLSSADDTLSRQDALSILSNADSTVSLASPEGRSAHRDYMSPLRSKRYEGLRSSLLSPAFSGGGRPRTAHSRTSSATSLLHLQQLSTDPADEIGPRQTLRWSRLRRISDHLYSASGRKAFGTPTCLTVSGMLAFGTTKGLLLLFDYQQVCKHVIGNGTRATEAGAVTAIALSADHTFAAAAYADGSILSWDLSRPTSPAKLIPPIRLEDTTSKHGHLGDARITHLSFVGTRHSLFLSADARGMVFCHSFHRRKLVSNVETIRMLGRYPTLPGAPPLKPSATFAATVLPLGTIPHFTDTLGLTAILTPYKLVIVSTTPSARTQYKLNRPSGVYAEAEQISGSACWFPCVASVKDPQRGTCPLLAVSWSRRLQILSISAGKPLDEVDPVIPIVVEEVGSFQCEESIVALRWYTKGVLCLVTTSHQMLLLDAIALSLVGQADLIGKHILTYNINAGQLQYYFEQREAEYVNQSFTEDYHGSFIAYKGRFFLLGHSEVTVGSVLTWKDRVQALTQQGLFIEAIALLEAYHDGSIDLSLAALPKDVQQRRQVVSAYGAELLNEAIGQLQSMPARELLQAVFSLCLTLNDNDALFDEVYDACENDKELFLQALAEAVLVDSVRYVPPEVVQELVSSYVKSGLQTRLEDVLCHLDPSSLDTNQLTQLCKQHGLMNALAYVWNSALADYVTPLVEFLVLIKSVLRATATSGDAASRALDLQHLGANTVNAVKIFSYLSLTLTGRSFPNGEPLQEQTADSAKSALYAFLFSGVSVVWPPGSNHWILTDLARPEPTFPYLRLLLHFDGPTFLACLDEAFEDAFLNEGPDDDRPRSATASRTMTRQFIINILLESASDASHDDVLALYMFIARNVPKYPQFILLSGSVLQRILYGLCEYGDVELAEDCQLAVEMLLSVFKPSSIQELMPKLQAASFFRVLKTLCRAEGDHVSLLRATLQDEGSESQIFACIEELLGNASRLDSEAREHVQQAIVDEAEAIVALNSKQAAAILDRCCPTLHPVIYQQLEARPTLRLAYVRPLLALDTAAEAPLPEWADESVLVSVLALLCQYDRSNVLSFLSLPGLLDVASPDTLTTVLEEHDALEGLVKLLSLTGQRKVALERTLAYLVKLSAAVIGSEPTAIDDAQQLLSKVDPIAQYVRLGALLCAEEVQVNYGLPDTTNAETMWVSLLNDTFNLTLQIGQALEQKGRRKHVTKTCEMLKTLLRDAMGTLLLATASRQDSAQTGLFLRILRRFLEQSAQAESAHQPGYSQTVQNLLRDVFDAYLLGGQLLRLAEQILGHARAKQFARQTTRREAGWRAGRLVCHLCDRPVHPPSFVRQLAKQQQQQADASRLERRQSRTRAVLAKHGLKGERQKGKSRDDSIVALAQVDDESHMKGDDVLENLSKVLVHACGHVSHEHCLRQRLADRLEHVSIHCVRCVERRAMDERTAVALEARQEQVTVVLP